MSALLFGYEVDAAGQSVPVTNTDINYHPPKGHYIWLHFDALNPDTRTWLTADVDVDTIATRTLLADDSRPRTIVHDDALLMNLRGVNLNPGADPEDMVGIRFFIQEDRIISVERRPLKATRDMAERLGRSGAPLSPGTFIATFALMLTERMNPTIIEINEQVDALEEQVDDMLISSMMMTACACVKPPTKPRG